MTQGAAEVTSWKSVAQESQRFAALHDLHLQSDLTYSLEVKVTNMAGLTSDVISTDFTVELEPPVDAGVWH